MRISHNCLLAMSTQGRLIVNPDISAPITISNEVNAWLKQFPSKNEIRSTLFTFESNKLLGPDGVPFDFSKHHCSMVKNDVIVVVLWFFQKRLMIRPLNHTFVTLIPKKVASSTLLDYKADFVRWHTI